MVTIQRVRRWLLGLALGCFLLPFAPSAASAKLVQQLEGSRTEQHTQDQMIEAAVHARMEGVSYLYAVQIQRVEGAFARVEVRTAVDWAASPAWTYLHEERRNWVVLAGPATAFDAQFYRLWQIPETMRIGNRFEAALIEEVARQLREHTKLGEFSLELDRIDQNVARLELLPVYESNDVYVYARHAENHWSVIGYGSEFDEAYYARRNIPRSLWLRDESLEASDSGCGSGSD